MTGQHLVLLLWTLWLVGALLSVGGRVGAVLLVVVGGLGLGLIPTGLVDWRAYLIVALAVHVLAAASRVVSQLTAAQPSVQAPRDRPPLVIAAAVQPGPHAPAASARHRSLGVLPDFVPRWPPQVLAGSVSLAGVIWLLILRPAVHWLYRADIPIMIGTVALLVVAEYGCWRFYKYLDRRLAETARQLQEERQQRQDNDKRSHERSEWLEKRLELAEAGMTQRRGELRQAQADLRRAQERLGQAQAGLHQAQGELGQMQAALGQAQGELRQVQGSPPSGQGQLPPVPGEQPAASAEQASPVEQPPAPCEPPPTPGERAQAEVASTPPEGGEGDAQAWYRAPGDVQAWAESAQVADAETIRVELIRVARLRPDPGSQAVRPGIVIERRTETFSRTPGETVGEAIGRAEAHIGQGIEAAASQYAAQAIGDPLWKTVSERWAADGSAGIDAAAGTVTDFDAYVHNLLLGRPARQISFELGLPGPIPAVLGGVAGAAELPIDRPLDTVARIIQVGGIVVGVMSGHPVLVSACFKSLVHDKFIGALRAGIERTFSTADVSLRRDRAATDPAADRAALQRATERDAAAWQALELVDRAREAAHQPERETAARQAPEPGPREREAARREAERTVAERQARLTAERAETVRREAARFRHDPPDRHGPATGPSFSPFR